MTTQLFYGVDAPEVKPELFDTLQDAKTEFEEMLKLNLGPRLYIAQVNDNSIEIIKVLLG